MATCARSGALTAITATAPMKSAPKIPACSWSDTGHPLVSATFSCREHRQLACTSMQLMCVTNISQASKCRTLAWQKSNVPGGSSLAPTFAPSTSSQASMSRPYARPRRCTSLLSPRPPQRFRRSYAEQRQTFVQKGLHFTLNHLKITIRNRPEIALARRAGPGCPVRLRACLLHD